MRRENSPRCTRTLDGATTPQAPCHPSPQEMTSVAKWGSRSISPRSRRGGNAAMPAMLRAVGPIFRGGPSTGMVAASPGDCRGAAATHRLDRAGGEARFHFSFGPTAGVSPEARCAAATGPPTALASPPKGSAARFATALEASLRASGGGARRRPRPRTWLFELRGSAQQSSWRQAEPQRCTSARIKSVWMDEASTRGDDGDLHTRFGPSVEWGS